MLQQIQRVTGRSAYPLVQWMERWADLGGSAALEANKTTLKTLDSVPGPSFVRFAWKLFAQQGLSRLHELQVEGLRRYGPVWKARFGFFLTVHVSDPALIEQVLRQEGHHPMRSELSSWKDYRKLRGHHYGLLTAEGEEWQSVRSLLGKHMLRPKAVEAYDQTLNSVVDDLIAKLRLRRCSQGFIADVGSEFYRFGLEGFDSLRCSQTKHSFGPSDCGHIHMLSNIKPAVDKLTAVLEPEPRPWFYPNGISSVLFESRVGCLDEVIPKETEHFIQSINTMFLKTLPTMVMPVWLRQLFPKNWNIFCQSWDFMFNFAKKQIDQRLTAEAEKIARGEKVEGRYLTYFLSQTEMPMKTIYSNVTELLLAGVDTISGTMSWSLYELSRHPEVQNSIRKEVLNVLGSRKIPTAADVARMPLLKATVKEVLRLYPVIPANARVIPKDIQVGDYLIPKKTLITLCQFATSRDPAVFPNPDQFQPQRWLNKDQTHHPYASLPFGVGKRSCIGRRIAELELYLALSRILMEFEVKPDPEGIAVIPKTRTLLVPGSCINLQFIEQ